MPNISVSDTGMMHVFEHIIYACHERELSLLCYALTLCVIIVSDITREI